ncbi:tyrosine-type recombinase/integrase [Rhodococcus koreensis]
MTNYNSAFASHITAMLELRDSLSLYTGPLPFVMQNFDRFCLAKYPDTTALTRELATQWCDEGKSAGRSGYKMHAIRSFGKYLQSVGADAFVMPSDWIGKPARRLPHMFTDDELERFFNACDRIEPSKLSPYRDHIIPVMFRHMLGYGLRPQEARRLRRADVDLDLDAMVLTIVHGKRRKDRLVPVGDDMTVLRPAHMGGSRPTRPTPRTPATVRAPPAAVAVLTTPRFVAEQFDRGVVRGSVVILISGADMAGNNAAQQTSEYTPRSNLTNRTIWRSTVRVSSMRRQHTQPPYRRAARTVRRLSLAPSVGWV